MYTHTHTMFQNVVEIQYDFRCYSDNRMGNFAVATQKNQIEKTKNLWIKSLMEMCIGKSKWKFLKRRINLIGAERVWRPWNGILFLYKFQTNKERMAWQSYTILLQCMTKRLLGNQKIKRPLPISPNKLNSNDSEILRDNFKNSTHFIFFWFELM